MLWFAAGYFTVRYAIANIVRLVNLPCTALHVPSVSRREALDGARGRRRVVRRRAAHKGVVTVKVLADLGHSVAKWLTQPLDLVWLVMAVPAPFPSHTAERQACQEETLWQRSKAWGG